MRRVFFHCAVIVLFMAQSVAQATEPVGRIVQQDLGRSYGLMVGELIQHNYVIEVNEDYALNQSSLPVAGDLSYWLTLRDVQLSSTHRGDSLLYRLDLTYQTFYAPLDVRMLEIPAIALDFSTEDQQKFNITLAKWPFTMSPIKEISISGVGTENDTSTFMKAAVAPRFIPLSHFTQSLFVYGGLFLITAIILLIMNGWLPSISSSPFITARKKIKKHRQHDSDPLQNSQACLQAVHEAINKRAGYIVFASQLARFLTDHPQFSSLQAPLTDFFQQSRDCFFLDKPVRTEIFDDCIRLCTKLANADKVSLSS